MYGAYFGSLHHLRHFGVILGLILGLILGSLLGRCTTLGSWSNAAAVART